MHLQPVEDLDALSRFHDVEAAVMDADHLFLPADPVEELVPLLAREPLAGELVLLWLGTLDDGTPVSTLTMRLPQLDNLGSANVDGNVHPDHRGAGLGRQLRAFALEEVRQQGRSRVFVEAAELRDGTEGAAGRLLREVGARPVLQDHRRTLDLLTHPPGEVHPVPEGYRVEQWVDHAPEALVDGCAYLMGRMILDAPMGELDYEQEKWDAVRYRQKEETAAARQRVRFATAVVHEATGQVAGLTDIGVARSRPQIAYQWDTIVDPEHRGRRLGMVLKTWNHRFVVDRLPGVERINTWNAANNSYMVAVNDALGFEVAETWNEWQLDL